MNQVEAVFKNQVYSRLSEHIVFENEISKSRKDYESLLFTLLVPGIFTDSEKREIVKDVEANIASKKLTSLSEIKLLSLFVAVSKEVGLSVSKDVKDSLKSMLERLDQSASYPAASKSLICWILDSSNEFEKQLDKIKETLTIKSKEHQDKFQYLDGIELAFGVSSRTCLDTIINTPRQFFLEAQSWSRDKIAKSIIRLSQDSRFNTYDLVKLLETKIDEELSSWVEPDVWLAVIESEKVINSNIPPDDINVILDNLSNKSSSWAKMVSKINDDGVYLKLNNIIKSPAFSPIEDSLSLIALNISGRDTVIQLSQDEYKKLSKFADLKNLIPFSSKILYSYLSLLISVSIIIGCLSFSLFQNASLETISKFLELTLNGEFGTIMARFDYILLFFSYCLWWLYKLINIPFDSDRIKTVTLLTSPPIFSSVLKKIIK